MKRTTTELTQFQRGFLWGREYAAAGLAVLAEGGELGFDTLLGYAKSEEFILAVRAQSQAEVDRSLEIAAHFADKPWPENLTP